MKEKLRIGVERSTSSQERLQERLAKIKITLSEFSGEKEKLVVETNNFKDKLQGLQKTSKDVQEGIKFIFNEIKEL